MFVRFNSRDAPHSRNRRSKSNATHHNRKAPALSDQARARLRQRTYTGTERVRFVNRGEHPTSTLYFHLYPNVRVPGYAPPPSPVKAEPGQQTSDEPRLEINEVRNANDDTVLVYDL